MHGILTSLSGMLNAFRRNDITAHNITNSQTSGFRPTQVSNEEVPTGGVQISETTQAPAPVPEDLQLPAGSPPLSNVDLANEVTNQLINKNAFQANLNALKAQDEALGSLLDIKDDD